MGPISAWDDFECGDLINTDKVIVGHHKPGATYFVAVFGQDDGLDLDSREQRLLKSTLRILNEATWVLNNHDPGRWTGEMLLHFSHLMKDYSDDLLGAQILGQGEMMALLDDADYRVTFKVA